MGRRGILLGHVKSSNEHTVDPDPGNGSNGFLASISMMFWSCVKVVVSDGVAATVMFLLLHYRLDVTS